MRISLQGSPWGDMALAHSRILPATQGTTDQEDTIEICLNNSCIFSCEKCLTQEIDFFSHTCHLLCHCNVQTILWRYHYPFYWETKLFYVFLIKVYRKAIFWPRLLPYMVVAPDCSRVWCGSSSHAIGAVASVLAGTAGSTSCQLWFDRCLEARGRHASASRVWWRAFANACQSVSQLQFQSSRLSRIGFLSSFDSCLVPEAVKKNFHEGFFSPPRTF